jgi:hypothetical protein
MSALALRLSTGLRMEAPTVADSTSKRLQRQSIVHRLLVNMVNIVPFVPNVRNDLYLYTASLF